MSLSNVSLQSEAVQSILNALNARLPKGITAELSIMRMRLSILYSVKFMHEGVRANLGKFSSYDAALNAMVNYKYKKFITISMAEVKEQEDKILSALTQSSNIIETASKELMELEAMRSGFNLALMEAAYKEVPQRFSKGVSFDFYWEDAPEALASAQALTGIFKITPSMIKKFIDLKKLREEKNVGESPIELEDLKSPLLEDKQSIDDPEIQAMLKRIEEMGDEN